MTEHDKENDSPQLLAAKAVLRTARGQVKSVRAQLAIAQHAEARAMFDLLMQFHGLVEGSTYANKDGVGVLETRPDFPHVAMRMYKKDGSLSERVLPAYRLESLVKATPPQATPARDTGAKPARQQQLKVWQGNLDGSNEGAVAGTSAASACKALNTSARGLKKYFHLGRLDDPG